MKFEAEDPSVVSSSGSEGVDRTQGAARAISVCLAEYAYSPTDASGAEFHRHCA
jgi:hypothetical protein